MNQAQTNIQTQGRFKTVWQLLSYNGRAFLGFELLYALVGAVIVLPILLGLFKCCLLACGLSYLAPHNLVTLLASPLFWLWVLVFVLVSAFYALVDVSACILLCEMSRRSLKASLWALTKMALKKAGAVVTKGHRLFALFMVLVLPLTGFMLVPSFLGTFKIPDFILTTITYHTLYIVAFLVVVILLFIFVVRARFCLHFFVLENASFKESLRKSGQLGRGHHLSDVLFCLAMALLAAVAVTAALAVLFLIILLLGSLFQLSNLMGQILEVGISSMVLVAGSVIVLMALTCIAPLSYAFLSTLFYHHKGEDLLAKDEDELAANALNFEALQARPTKTKRIVARTVEVLLYVAAVVAVVFFYRGIAINAEDYRFNTEVVAHRCGANYAPENTVAALNKAADMGANWCEIDAQQLADGTIIVMHDTNFSRTAGLDANTWEVTYDQIKTLDAGSSYSAEYTGEPVPTLEAMIAAAKARGIKLQIEIKPSGYDEGIEQHVVDIVNKLGFQDQCLLASQSYDCIQKLRACDANAPILYIMSIASGDIASIPEANSYSVESTWTSAALSANVHSKPGAVLCAWTVNSRTSMERCINNGVDQLVTDDIELAREVADAAQAEQSWLLDILSIFHVPELGSETV